MTSFSAPGGVSKVTPQASIIINATADSYDRALRRGGTSKTLYTNVSDEDSFCIARGELCFAMKKKISGTQVYGNTNPSVQIFTSANGMKTPDALQKANADTIKRALARSIWFVGLAQGDKMKRDFEKISL
jgi:hypothetical protein